MKFPPPLWVIALFACSLVSCGMLKPAKTENPVEKPKVDPPKLVGRIASIPADKRFVLIQSYGKWNIGTGTILTTRGENDRTANLLVTGESLDQFAAADLKSGTLEVGDAVYSRHVPQPSEPSSVPKAPSPSLAPVPELPE
jgi:hypothetical protein